VFTAVGSELTILLENTSTGVPAGFSVADSLLTSVAFNLPGLTMAGAFAEVGPGSVGLGQWAARGVGAGVGEQWKWTNAGGGDLLAPYAQVISTVNGSVRGAAGTRFSGGTQTVGGPFGGIATLPPLVNVPNSQFAVGGSIVFGLMLNGTLTDSQLTALAMGSMVEFGSDRQYLQTTPAPGAALLGLIGFGLLSRRWRGVQ
jgi:hypothetical protein